MNFSKENNMRFTPTETSNRYPSVKFSSLEYQLPDTDTPRARVIKREDVEKAVTEVFNRMEHEKVTEHRLIRYAIEKGAPVKELINAIHDLERTLKTLGAAEVIVSHTYKDGVFLEGKRPLTQNELNIKRQYRIKTVFELVQWFEKARSRCVREHTKLQSKEYQDYLKLQKKYGR